MNQTAINNPQPIRVFWVEATGNQRDDENGLQNPDYEIDLTDPGEDRWIYTTIQTVDPGNNSVAKKKKYLKLVEVPPGNIIIDRATYREACKMTQNHLVANWREEKRLFDKMLEWYLFGSEENEVSR